MCACVLLKRQGRDCALLPDPQTICIAKLNNYALLVNPLASTALLRFETLYFPLVFAKFRSLPSLPQQAGASALVHSLRPDSTLYLLPT